MKTLVFATANEHKANEIRAILPETFDLKSLSDIGFTTPLLETSDTIKGNAIQKVDQLWDSIEKNCFADDTGLEVQALQGQPGVYSARYAREEATDEENMEKLLTQLQGIDNRIAHFKTVIAYKTAQDLLTFDGILTGKIALSKRGTNGFGYDPIFIPDGYSKHLAEFSLEEKNKISHRAIAFKKFIDYLKNNN